MKSNFIMRTAAGMLAMALAAGALPALLDDFRAGR